MWDLNKDTEAPISRKKTGNKAVNCIKWNMDGRKIVSGDSEGVLSLWSVDKELSMPKNEDFNKLERLISSS